MIPIGRNDGKVVGEYDQSTNIFTRDRKVTANLIMTHLKNNDGRKEFNASTFDEHLITDIQKAVVGSGNSLDTLILVDNYKEKKKEHDFENMDAKERLAVVQEVGDEAYMEAVEYFEYNTEGAWVGDRTPIFVVMKDLLNPIEETN